MIYQTTMWKAKQKLKFENGMMGKMRKNYTSHFQTPARTSLEWRTS
jgi:hypothetical protein